MKSWRYSLTNRAGRPFNNTDSVAQNDSSREKATTGKMNGIRVYINMAGVGPTLEPAVFYSRRADGPYYRWRFEQKSEQWRFRRVQPPVSTLKALRIAPWDGMPPALQKKLAEHYFE
jgi:hypothetical protein